MTLQGKMYSKPFTAAGAVTYQVRQLLLMKPPSCIGEQFQVLFMLLPFQLPTEAPWKAAEDGPSPWAPDTHIGDLEGVPDAWLPPGIVLQCREARSLSVSSK